MDENMIPNADVEENTAPVADEATEEAVEDVVEETVIEEPAEEAVEDAVEEATEEDEVPIVYDETLEPTEVKKNGKAGKIIAIAVVAVIVVAVAVFGIVKLVTRNPYNEMGYVNVSGRTIAEVAESAGVDLNQFLANYGLPADMPADTEEAAAYYNIPVKYIAQMYGMDTDTLKEMLGLGDDVTDDTPWGEAEGKATLSKYVGDENLEEFKVEYGLGDEVTGDTLWGEIRNTVDKKTLADRKAQEEADAATTGSDDTLSTEADADVADTAEE